MSFPHSHRPNESSNSLEPIKETRSHSQEQLLLTVLPNLRLRSERQEENGFCVGVCGESFVNWKLRQFTLAF